MERLMEKKIGAYEARRQLGSLINEVQYGGDVYVIERHGQPVVALLPAEEYVVWKEWRQWHDALAEAQALQERILARRGGEPVPSSVDTLRELREERLEEMP
jgi:prevent-host-death family protein